MGYLGSNLEDYYSYELMDNIIERLSNEEEKEKILFKKFIDRYDKLKNIIEEIEVI